MIYSTIFGFACLASTLAIAINKDSSLDDATVISDLAVPGDVLVSGLTTRKLWYGPAININHTIINKIPRAFDDTKYMDYGDNEFRYLREIKCYYRSLGSHLIALEEYYTRPDGSERVKSPYHGFYPPELVTIKEKSYELVMGQRWAFVSYKQCEGRIVAIHFGVTGGHGGLACGDYYSANPECKLGILWPPKGRYIAGLYGISNKNLFKHIPGITGIGLITLPK